MTDKHLIDSIKRSFSADLDEWIGLDIPDEGTEDYEVWQSRAQQIESINSIADVLAYAESHVPDLEAFLEEWGLSK